MPVFGLGPVDGGPHGLGAGPIAGATVVTADEARGAVVDDVGEVAGAGTGTGWTGASRRCGATVEPSGAADDGGALTGAAGEAPPPDAARAGPSPGASGEIESVNPTRDDGVDAVSEWIPASATRATASSAATAAERPKSRLMP